MNVHIQLKSSLLDINTRIGEIQDIRDWINELVCWDDSLYEIRFHSSGQRMIVWFEHDEHAAMFVLRWA